MPKATKVKKSSKKSSFSAAINELESCIASDQDKLLKVYPKSLADIEKAIVQATKELKNAKSSKLSITKGRQPKVDPTALLVQKLDDLKNEKASLQTGFKKLKAQQKLLNTFEKSWIKQIKSASKKTKKVSKTKNRDVFQQNGNSFQQEQEAVS